MGVVAARILRIPCENVPWGIFSPDSLSTPPGIRRIMGVVEVRILRTLCESALRSAFLPACLSTPPGICGIVGEVCGGGIAARGTGLGEGSSVGGSVEGEEFVYCLAEAGGQFEGKFGGRDELTVFDGIYGLARYSHDVGQFLL